MWERPRQHTRVSWDHVCVLQPFWSFNLLPFAIVSRETRTQSLVQWLVHYFVVFWDQLFFFFLESQEGFGRKKEKKKEAVGLNSVTRTHLLRSQQVVAARVVGWKDTEQTLTHLVFHKDVFFCFFFARHAESHATRLMTERRLFGGWLLVFRRRLLFRYAVLCVIRSSLVPATVHTRTRPNESFGPHNTTTPKNLFSLTLNQIFRLLLLKK